MTRITKVSDKCLAFIKAKEGFESKAYLCPANVPTIGYGTTYYSKHHKVKLTDPAITEAQATEYLKSKLEEFETAVDSFTRDDIKQNQFDALVTFAYNVGTTALKGSTLLKLVNKNPDDPKIRDEFNKWVNAAGKKLAGLVTRRKEEADLYFS